MSDFFGFSLASAMLYFVSLVVVDYAYRKTKKTKQFLVCLVLVAFSILNGWMLCVNQNKIPVEAVSREWNRYATHCKQEHISWSDLTFPEWLSLVASE